MTDNDARFGGRVAHRHGRRYGDWAGHRGAAASEGATVIVAEVKPEFGESTAAELRRAGGQARFVACDVARPPRCRR